VILCLVRMYLDSPTRLCRLERVVEFHALPRIGEWLKLSNAEMGDYFAFSVREVTHRQGDYPEIVLDRLPPEDGKNVAFDEVELEEYVASYAAEGWTHESTAQNKERT
jgi:hypothetical protein